MRHRRLAVLIILAAIMLSPDSPSPSRAVASSGACTPRWHSVPAPVVDLRRIEAIAPVTANDGWAVGHVGIGPSVTLIEHWNGRRWQRVPSPSRWPQGMNELHAISALRRNAVWAVGNQGAHSDLDAATSNLIMRWNGRQWRIDPSPTGPPGEKNRLRGVAAIAANDVWAVGGTRDGTSPLLAHWDGQKWSVTEQKQIAGSFEAVTALSSDDVWAVGEADDIPLAEHWNGKRWSIAPVPAALPGGCGNCFISLNTVAGSAHDDLWATGYDESEGSYIYHWNGSSWLLDEHLRTSGLPSLRGIAAISRDSAWIGGIHGLLHWNGRTWKRMNADEYSALAVLRPQDVWAARSHRDTDFYDRYSCR